MEEIWKDVIVEKNGITYNYTGKYQVSNFGRVRNIKGKILKPTNLKDYKGVSLCKHGKHELFTIHRLVAFAFIKNPNPTEWTMVNHKDENKHNNCVDNLEWCDARYNANYGTKIQRSSDKFRGRLIGEKNPMYGKPGNMRGRIGSENPSSKKVKCLETGQIFDSIKLAEQWCGKKGISACCRGKQKTVAGYHWIFIEKESENK